MVQYNLGRLHSSLLVVGASKELHVYGAVQRLCQWWEDAQVTRFKGAARLWCSATLEGEGS